MMHKAIQLKNISLSFPHKNCFINFSVTIPYGSRIAIIGNNGSGKSSLLKILQGIIPPTEGQIYIPADVSIAYVPQVIEEYESSSGGERFNQALTASLSSNPNVLLLDEPTNHLDIKNRTSLLRMLNQFSGTLIIASHDIELLRSTHTQLWDIDNAKINEFLGTYDDYKQGKNIKCITIQHKLAQLNKQKKDTHHALMQEQSRAKSSRIKGEKNIQQRKWPTVVSTAKARRAEQTSGRKRSHIKHQKNELIEKLSNLRVPEIIKPKFYLTSNNIGKNTIASITEGAAGYAKKLLSDINVSVMSGERIAITGNNGSGKSTLIKALLNSDEIQKSGTWHVPNLNEIGYLDQHYNLLQHGATVLQIIENVVTWPTTEIRKHLNDFLFRKNEEVNAKANTLSGGEKARLCLALIAAKTPKLLLLDEITNNLDLETRNHVIEVLKAYPGAMIVISHDEDFLRAIDIVNIYHIQEGKCELKDK